MYFIKWIENGKEKSFVAEGYIELQAVLEDKQQFNPTYDLTYNIL